MPLKLVCPNCRADVRLNEPLPMPGAAVQCERCATPIAVTYPPGVIEQLKARGKRFADPTPSRSPPAPPPRVEPSRAPASRSAGPEVAAAPAPKSVPRAAPPPPPSRAPASANGRLAHEDRDSEAERQTEAAEGAHRNGANGANGRGWSSVPAPDRTTSSEDYPPAERGGARGRNGASDVAVRGTPKPAARTPAPQARTERAPSSKPSKPSATPKPAPPRGAPKRRGGWLGALAGMGCLGVSGVTVASVLVVALLGVFGVFGGYWYFSQGLPTVEKLQEYSPPTVTVVTDRNGEMMGEIFEEKRYVVPIDQIPDHVKNAFLAAEDANFYRHGGVDFMGIFRAVIRNTLSGRKAQGASTITQQVARNSFLSKEKSYSRKAKEIILSWRIEDAYEKDHILFLYLNEVFLGAMSYGVEAASRTYFGKHVQDITIAEAAILAGLPQRPTEYSPYKGWSSARARQEYVIGQMESKGFITSEQAKQALAEDVKIASRENKFRSKAPYFTEHVRRYLVDKYGEDRVLHEGLKVSTTCDLPLQTLAQKAVKDGVYETDQRMGYRRKGVKNIGKGNIAKTREEMEQKLRKDWAEEQDPAGRVEVPAKSVLEVDRVYDAVITEVSPKWAKFGIGANDAALPISWGDWIYDPDPSRSWRGRAATDFTANVDSDGDGKRDGAILQAGDMVKVRVVALSAKDGKVAKAFENVPGVGSDTVAVKIFQVPEVESALLSMEVPSGAVRAMVGGSDFDKSEFNRTVQARRQVGSTFKPIVYAAAVESKRVTAATVVADAPLAMATADEFVWKPSNYSNDYEGNMTMRLALMKSKNTCTVRILEAADPGMNNDVVYKFARRLGIGGPPTHTLPEGYVPTPKNDVLCPWVKETPRSTICMDRYPAKDPNLTDAAHRAQLKPGDEYYCRACDMSMGLGSASLTMEEMIRAYSAFATGGKLVQPYYVEKVEDRAGNVLEQHEPTPPVQVMDPAVASIANWLMEGVVNGGTASQAGSELHLRGLAGKTGTTNDEKDAWFVGFTNDVLTAVWFGYDQPQTLGVSSTGGRTSLPVWIEYMKVAAPRSKDRELPMHPSVQWAMIDEATGRRVTSGGVSYPFLAGTVPEGTGLAAGQISIEDVSGGGL